MMFISFTGQVPRLNIADNLVDVLVPIKSGNIDYLALLMACAVCWGGFLLIKQFGNRRSEIR